MRPSMRGFTLVELMVVILILGIITSIAVPTYRNYVLRANRVEATGALLRIRAAEEKFFLQNNNYTGELGLTGLRLTNVNGTSMTTDNGRYTIDFQVAPTINGYTARATAIGAQQKDTNCTTFTITDQGVRTTSPGNLATCWK